MLCGYIILQMVLEQVPLLELVLALELLKLVLALELLTIELFLLPWRCSATLSCGYRHDDCYDASAPASSRFRLLMPPQEKSAKV